MNLEGKEEDPFGFTGQDLIENETDSILNRLSVLVETRDSLAGQGCLLTNNLNKQIERRRSQLVDSLQIPSRESSVIRCASTPNNRECQTAHLTFDEPVSSHQPTTAPFQVYIDNPSEFYSLLPPEENHKTPIVSTDSSELSVFSEDLEMAERPSLFDLPDVKRGVTSKTSRLEQAIDLYSPDDYPPNVVASNKDTWIGKVEEKFFDLVDFADGLKDRDDISEEDVQKIDNWVKKAKTNFKKYNLDVNNKCNNAAGQTSNAGPPFAAALTRNSSNASTASVSAERKRIAEVDVEVDSERITDGVKALNSEIRKFSDWTSAESHDIELAMTKVDSWKTQMKSLKEKLWSMKKNTNSFDLDTAILVRSEAAVNSLNAELELVIGHIEHEDSERCLYSLNKSKTSNIKYPLFTGSIDEDFIKFQHDIKNCFRVNRIRLEDQPSKLRDNLKGSVVKLIPVTMTNIDDCWAILESVYGDPSRVMTSRKAKIKAMGNFPKSNVKSAAAIKSQVEWLLQMEICIKDIFDIAEMSDDMDREAFNTSTYRILIHLFPLDVHTELAKIKGNVKAQTEALYTHVMTKRAELQSVLKDFDDSTPSSDSKSTKPSAKVNMTQLMPNATITFKVPQRFEKCRICTTLEAEGKTDGLYDGHTSDLAMGCPVFAAMNTQDRSKYCIKAKICIFCLDPNYVHKGKGSQHVNCIAFKRNYYFTCNNNSCKKHILVCFEHLNENQDKLERCKKFWGDKGRKFVTTCNLPVIASSNSSVSSQLPESETGTSFPAQKESTLASSDPDVVENVIEQVPQPVSATIVDDKVSQAAEKLKESAGADTIVHDLPPGCPLFMFSHARGKTRPINVFYDNGCSHMMLKEGVPGKELDAVMTRRGPITISAAGDTVVQVNHEWCVMMEKADGSKQIMVGVSADNLTSEFPQIPLADAHKDIIENLPKHKRSRLSQLKIPSEAGGLPDVLLGIQYNSCFPQILHTLPCGLFIAKLKLKSHDGLTTGCIGGPHETFSNLIGQCGDASRLMTLFISSLENFRKMGAPKLDSPMMSIEDFDFAAKMNCVEVTDIVGVQPVEVDKSPEVDNVIVSSIVPSSKSLQCQDCGCDVNDDPKELLEIVKKDIGEKKMRAIIASLDDPRDKLNDLKMLMKIMEEGIQLNYRCPKCRECFSCKNACDTERISIREEQEDEVIKESVKLDFENKKITASLPVRGDPAQYLSENRVIAEKVLESQCKKVQNDAEARESIVKSFEKLITNGYAVEFKDLTKEQQAKVLSKEPQHYLPWRVVFKESVSTPVRCVFDGSSKTPLLESGKGGRCLNDICMKGRINTLNLINMLLRFVVGSVAFCGDLKQFYCRIGLSEEQWNLQRVLYKENLEITAETKELIIKSLIFGVRSVSALSERAVLDLAESISNSNSRLEILLTIARFVDDIADSDVDKETVKNIIEQADKLFESVGLECKGWSISGSDPHPNVTHDGISVDVGGMTWFCKTDSYCVKIPPLHFGRKNRGKLRVGTEIFDGSFGDLKTFVPLGINKRIITSKYSSLFDPMGKYLPVTGGMKCQLRQVNNETFGWDDPVSLETRKLWIGNLWKLHNLKGIHFSRAIVPSDAVDGKLELIAAADAADLKVAGVWGRFKRRNGTYSCQHIIGRSLLARTDSTIPKEELESLTITSNLLWITRKALEAWVQDYIIISDIWVGITARNRPTFTF